MKRKRVLVFFYTILIVFQTISLYSQSNEEVLGLLLAKSESPVYTTWAPHGNYFASVWNNSLIFWNGENLSVQSAVTGHKSNIQRVKFSNNGRYFFTIAEDNAVVVREAGSCVLQATFQGSDVIEDADFSFDGYSLAIPLDGKNLSFYLRLILTQRNLLTIMVGHEKPIYSVDMHNEKRMLLTAGTDNNLFIWEPLDGVLLEKVEIFSDNKVPCIFNPAGTHYLKPISENMVSLIPVDSENDSLIMINEKDIPINAACFSSDGKYLAMPLKTGIIRLYDSNTGMKIKDFSLKSEEVNPGNVVSVSISPNGNYLTCGTDNGCLYIWKIDGTAIEKPGKLIKSLDIASLAIKEKTVEAISIVDENFQGTPHFQESILENIVPQEKKSIGKRVKNVKSMEGEKASEKTEEKNEAYSEDYSGIIPGVVRQTDVFDPYGNSDTVEVEDWEPETELQGEPDTQGLDTDVQENEKDLSMQSGGRVKEKNEKIPVAKSKKSGSAGSYKELVPLNYISFGGGWSTINDEKYIGSVDVFFRYDNMCFYPIYWGLNFIGGVGLPSKDFPYEYKFPDGKSKAPHLISMKPQFVLGFTFYMPKSKCRFFAEVFGGAGFHCMWNMNFSQSVNSDMFYDWNCGFAIGAEIKHVFLRTSFGYDSLVGPVFDCSCGASFNFGKTARSSRLIYGD